LLVGEDADLSGVPHKIALGKEGHVEMGGFAAAIEE
jgi:hypothetical protein